MKSQFKNVYFEYAGEKSFDEREPINVSKQNTVKSANALKFTYVKVQNNVLTEHK